MSTDPLIDNDAIAQATERACSLFHRAWPQMDEAARSTARQHMRPRIAAAAVVFEDVVRRKLEGRKNDAEP